MVQAFIDFGIVQVFTFKLKSYQVVIGMLNKYMGTRDIWRNCGHGHFTHYANKVQINFPNLILEESKS